MENAKNRPNGAALQWIDLVDLLIGETAVSSSGAASLLDV